MTETANQGQSPAHTRRESAGGETNPALGGRDPDGLLDGLPMVTRGDLLETAAEMTATERRGRGRPPGSPNRKNKEMIAFLEARGIRDPWLTLAVIQSADTIKLAEMLGTPALNDEGRPIMLDGKPMMIPAEPLKVLQLQRSAAEALMPYHHAKQPQQLDLPDLGDRLPLMVIGEMNVSIERAADGFMSAGEIVENQSLSIEGSVRDKAHSSHDSTKTLESQDNPTPNT